MAWRIWSKKLLIIFFSSFFLLELLIRISSSLFVFFQESRNVLSLNSGKRVIKIVTIGESTTAVAANEANTFLTQETSYPYQLEMYLNKYSKKFHYKVENKGVMAGNSELAVDQLSVYGIDNRPDLIISMFGMKDFASREYNATNNHDFFNVLKKYSKIYSLISQLQDEDEIDKMSMELSKTSQPILKEFAIRAVDSALCQQASFDKIELSTYKTIQKILMSAYNASFSGQTEKAIRILKEIIREKNFGHFALFDVYVLNNKRKEAEKVLLDYKRMAPRNPFVYTRLISFYLDLGYEKEAKNTLNETIALKIDHNFEIELAKIRIDLNNKYYQRASDKITKICGKLSLVKNQNSDEEEWLILLNEKASNRLFYLCSNLKAEIYYSLGKHVEAKHVLESMLQNENISNFGAAISLLLKIYEKERDEERSYALINRIIRKNKRLGEYYHLINHFKIFNKKLPNFEQFEKKIVEFFPKTIESYDKLLNYATTLNSKLLIMQYPTFPLSIVQRFVLEVNRKDKEDIFFLSNENIFDQQLKSQVFFEPRYPYNFNHYTRLGSGIIAAHVGEKVLEIMESE